MAIKKQDRKRALGSEVQGEDKVEETDREIKPEYARGLPTETLVSGFVALSFVFPWGLNAEQGFALWEKEFRALHEEAGLVQAGEPIPFRYELPCGCLAEFHSLDEIPRVSTRCKCGRNWTVHYTLHAGTVIPAQVEAFKASVRLAFEGYVKAKAAVSKNAYGELVEKSPREEVGLEGVFSEDGSE